MEALNRGALTVLHYLFDERKVRNGGPLRFKDLRVQTKISSATLSASLQTLTKSELVSLDDNGYSITSRGLLFVDMVLKRAEILLGPLEGKIRKIDSTHNPHDLQRAAADLAIGAKSELLMTTRRLGSLASSDMRDAAYKVFSALKQRGVKIEILGDPNLPEETRAQFVNEFGAQVRFLPSRLLERPPGILNPLMFQDFAHVMIVDQEDWLYIGPHSDERSHVGVSCLDDRVTAGYLRSIFQALWEFASSSSGEGNSADS
jgi:hypothetical protein